MNFDQMMAELRVEYVASLPGKIADIRAHLAANDLEKLRDDFHKLKGTGKTYGIPEISDLGETVEKLCMKKAAPVNEIVGLAIQVLGLIETARRSGQAFDVVSCAEFQKIRGYL